MGWKKTNSADNLVQVCEAVNGVVETRIFEEKKLAYLLLAKFPTACEQGAISQPFAGNEKIANPQQPNGCVFLFSAPAHLSPAVPLPWRSSRRRRWGCCGRNHAKLCLLKVAKGYSHKCNHFFLTKRLQEIVAECLVAFSPESQLIGRTTIRNAEAEMEPEM